MTKYIPSPKIANTTDPYRVCLVVPCTACGEPALLCCPQCGRAYCSTHVNLGMACMDCELRAPRREALAPVAGLVLTVGCLAGGGLALGDYILGTMGITVCTTSLIFAGILALIGRRAKARRASQSWPLVEGAQLEISAFAGESEERRLGFLLNKPRREKDMYRAARSAGFNRVQGCA